jgi:hypothetical protein
LSYEVGFGRRKRLGTAKQYLPPRVIESKKRMQFVLMKVSRSPVWAKLPYIDARKLHAFVDDYLAGRHENGYAAWRVYTASRWLDLFRP